MRRIASRRGATLTFSEMVASGTFLDGDDESRLRAEGEGVSPNAVQLVGRAPTAMAETARRVEAAGAEIIDINMGCPAKRVAGALAGSALMRDLDSAFRIIEAVVRAVARAGDAEDAPRLGRHGAKRARTRSRGGGGRRRDDNGARADALPVLQGRRGLASRPRGRRSGSRSGRRQRRLPRPRRRPRDAGGVGRAGGDDRPRGGRGAVARRRHRPRAGGRRAFAAASARDPTAGRARALGIASDADGGAIRPSPRAQTFGRLRGSGRRVERTETRAGHDGRCGRGARTVGAKLRLRRYSRPLHEPSRADRRDLQRRAARPAAIVERAAAAGPRNRLPGRHSARSISPPSTFSTWGEPRCCARGWPISCPSARRCSNSSRMRSQPRRPSTATSSTSRRRAPGPGRVVDAFVAPLPMSDGAVTLLLQERSIAEKMDRQLTHRERRPLGDGARRHARP